MSDFWAVACPGYATAFGTILLAAGTFWAVTREIRRERKAAAKERQRLTSERIQKASMVKIDIPVFEAGEGLSKVVTTRVANYSGEPVSRAVVAWQITTAAGIQTIPEEIGSLVTGAPAMVMNISLTAASPRDQVTVTASCEFEMMGEPWVVQAETGDLVMMPRDEVPWAGFGSFGLTDIIEAAPKRTVFLWEAKTRTLKEFTLTAK